MKNSLNATRKAVQLAKEYGGIPMVISVIVGASLADCLQNTLTIVWVFVARAYLIIEKIEFVEYWMVLVPCIPVAYKFSQQIARALILLEIHSRFFNWWIGMVAGAVTFLISFGGLADGMFPDVVSFWDYLLPRNLFKLLTITVISIAPISTIKIGVTVLKELVSDELQKINKNEVDLISKELDSIQQEETEAFEAKAKTNIGKRSKRSTNRNTPQNQQELLKKMLEKTGVSLPN